MGAAPILVLCNMTPAPHEGYRVGVPPPERWRELVNTDAEIYGGSNLGNGGFAQSQPRARPWRGAIARAHLAAAGGSDPAA